MLTRYIRLKADTDGLPYVYRDNTDNDMAHITYLPDAPVIEGELNYQQQLTAMHMRRLVRTIIGRSTLLTPISPAATGTANDIRLHTADTMFHAAINGIVKTVYAYDDPQAATKLEGGNRVRLPDYVASGRKDLVYLEMWFEEVMNPTAQGTADTTVYRYGMVHGFTDINNIKVTSYGELHETTRRVQLRGRIKVLAGAETLVGVTAKDSGAFTYSDVGGYLRAGTGDVSSAQNLNTVDGFTYAMPLVKVTRGSSASVMSAIEVVAPSTATLQQLATSTLKDVAQFGSDIANLQTTAASNANRVTQLESDNTAIKQTNTSLNSQLVLANTKIATLEKLTNKKTYTLYGIDKYAETYRGNTLGSFVSYNFGSRLYYLPPNFRFSISRVYAHLPSSAFQLNVYMELLGSTGVILRKSYGFSGPDLRTPAGGTYSYKSPYILRDGDSWAIDISEFDKNAPQYVHVYINTNSSGAGYIQTDSQIECEVDFTMTPK